MYLAVLGLAFLSLATAEEGVKQYDTSDLTEEKSKEIVHCFGQILCEAKRPDEFMRLEKAAKNCPPLITEIKDYVKTTYGLDDFYTQGEEVCSLPKLERVAKFMDFGQQVGTHFKKSNCEHEQSEMCDCYFLAFAAAEDMIEEYTDKGVCGNPEAAMENGAKEAQNIGTNMMG